MSSRRDYQNPENHPADFPLPESVKTKYGTTFNPRLDQWTFVDGVGHVWANFTHLYPFSPDLLHWVKHVLIYYAERYSPGYVTSIFTCIRKFAKYLVEHDHKEVNIFTESMLINYHASTTASRTSESLYALYRVIKKSHALGLPLASESALVFAQNIRGKRGTRGAHVKSMDPTKGPLTNLELESIQAALNTAYANRVLSFDAYLLVWLYILLGSRTIQLAALKVKDFVKIVTPQGDISYQINVPRAKQGDPPRTQFRTRPILRGVGELLELYLKLLKDSYESDDRLDGIDNLPIFPYFPRTRSSFSDEEYSTGFAYHHDNHSMAKWLRRHIAQVRPISERTGQPIKLHPRRLRYTLGTRAAEEGVPVAIIADLLDHTDINHAIVYVQARARHADRLSEMMGAPMLSLAQHFTGMLIKNELEATRGKDSSSRIIDLRIDNSGQPVGSCGQYSHCDFGAPIACYTCRNFQPWQDASHERVLAFLLARKKTLQAHTDARVASSLDRTILAVYEVIQQCSAVTEHVINTREMKNG